MNSNNLQNQTNSKLFNDLIDSSKSLPTASSDLGSIQLSLSEINRRTKELRSYVDINQHDHTKAHYLLANSGVAFDEVDSSLKSLKSNIVDVVTNNNIINTAHDIDASGTKGNLMNRNDINIGNFDNLINENNVNGDFTEIDTYLKIKKDENILQSIEMLLSNAAKDFDNFINNNLNLDWEQRKDKVRENFGILVNKNQNTLTQNHRSNKPFSSKNTSDLTDDSKIWNNNNFKHILMDNDQISKKLNVNEHYMLREKFEKYARIIHSFNNARQSKLNFSLNQEFISIFNNSSDSKTRPLLESWRILESMEKSNLPNFGNQKNSSKIISNAKTYLQSQFKDYIDMLYSKKMDEGLPTNINKVRSFIDSKLKNPSDSTWKINNLTIVNGEPLWALIFYLLRAGLIHEALEVTTSNKSSFKKIEQSFVAYLKAYVQAPNNELPVEFSTRLHTEYNQHIKSSLNGDPYRLAVYKIIGRCDLTRKTIPLITLNVEDWLWIHFMLINESSGIENSNISSLSDNNPIYEKFTLVDFQNIILSYDNSQFANHYLQILLLSGLYELAIEYAYTINEIDAVHLCIGLARQNLLTVTQNYYEPIAQNYRFISLNKNDNKRLPYSINLAKALITYIRSFKFSDPRIAVEYLLLITLYQDESQIELCHEAIRELVLQTKEFTLLLGKINRDGSRIPGVIENRKPLLFLKDEKDFLRIITEQSARKADEDGRIQDSLLLYQLSENYDVVITLINGLLSDTLSNSDLTTKLVQNNDNIETNTILLAQRLITIYSDNTEISSKISTINKETCMLLLNLVEIRQIFENKQWENTLTAMKQLDILPFTDEVDARKKSQEFSILNEYIIKCIPNMLIITLTCINKLINQFSQSEYHSELKAQQIKSLKNIARNCMIYAGMIQYKMPRETYSKLIKLDTSLLV